MDRAYGGKRTDCAFYCGIVTEVGWIVLRTQVSMKVERRVEVVENQGTPTVGQVGVQFGL